ncbi:MAG: right-handed parallel beta-helix repeat-containing protein [Clostridia bacterium]|nr:right-handed parallel beta-helix repeat-containing protein [Clostridia bacterium]
MVDSINAGVYNELHGHFDAEAAAMKEYILNMPDRTFKNAYYVSPNGDDANDGRTPETAWKTLERVNALEDAEEFHQQAVLFERGGVWRGGIRARSCTTYSAYGEGEKPRIYGSPKNFADESLWTPDETRENVWKLSLADWKGKFDGAFINVRDHRPNDAGNVIFIDAQGEVVMCGKNHENDDIEKDFDFHHDTENGVLYLWLSGDNPAKQYPQIEIVPNYAIFRCLEHHHHITIDNLCLLYANFGVSCSHTAHHITVRGCEIGWIGGCFVGRRERYGNGIELYGDCNDILIEDNWIYQCFDAGYSNQGRTRHETRIRFWQRDVMVQNNLIEKCCYNLEIWIGRHDLMRDCVYRDNILRFAGYNFERFNRYGSSLRCASHGCFMYSRKPLINVLIMDNLMDYSYRHMFSVAYPNVNGKGPQIFHNQYAQRDSDQATVAYCWDIGDEGFVPETTYYAHSQEEMEANIALVDQQARAVFFDGEATHE